MNVKAKVSEKLLETYASLSMQIKDLEAQREAIKPDLVEQFTTQGIEKMESEVGTFSIVRLSKWKYSKKLVEQEEKLKIAKVREQEKGIAKATVSETLRFQQKKDD